MIKKVFLTPFQKFIKIEGFSGILLLLSTIIALIWANSAYGDAYTSLWDFEVGITSESFELKKPLILWINDGLMAIFFFLVGLEIKREIMVGHLSSVSQVVLPGIAAIAGIVVPAFIYFWLNQGDEVSVRGWAIPSATDIAFALGIFSLFGSRVPISLKLFLLSVAIFDDLGAILIIAFFYSTELSLLSLIIAGGGLVLLFVLNRLSVRNQAAYIIVGVIVWVAVLKSGVHATLAGFAVACFIPLNVKNNEGHPMLPFLENALHPWVKFLILPLFAFANAGIALHGVSFDSLVNPVPLGIALGLFVGKQVGIFGACWIAIKLGLANLPDDATWRQFYAVSLLCGIGFTMSLFIGSLAFEAQDASYMFDVKLGVLVGSLFSAVIGSILISRSQPAKK